MVINVSETQPDLAKLLDRVAEGEEFVLGRAGRPIARLVPYTVPRLPRRPGRLSGAVWIAPDFDETPAQVKSDFEGPDAGST